MHRQNAEKKTCLSTVFKLMKCVQAARMTILLQVSSRSQANKTLREVHLELFIYRNIFYAGDQPEAVEAVVEEEYKQSDQGFNSM